MYASLTCAFLLPNNNASSMSSHKEGSWKTALSDTMLSKIDLAFWYCPIFKNKIALWIVVGVLTSNSSSKSFKRIIASEKSPFCSLHRITFPKHHLLSLLSPATL